MLVCQDLGLASVVQCIENGPLFSALPSKHISSFPTLHILSHHVSHSWLFPKCVAVIHHGGAGTVSSAILAGVPQVC